MNRFLRASFIGTAILILLASTLACAYIATSSISASSSGHIGGMHENAPLSSGHIEHASSLALAVIPASIILTVILCVALYVIGFAITPTDIGLSFAYLIERPPSLVQKRSQRHLFSPRSPPAR